MTGVGGETETTTGVNGGGLDDEDGGYEADEPEASYPDVADGKKTEELLLPEVGEPRRRITRVVLSAARLATV